MAIVHQCNPIPSTNVEQRIYTNIIQYINIPTFRFSMSYKFSVNVCIYTLLHTIYLPEQTAKSSII